MGLCLRSRCQISNYPPPRSPVGLQNPPTKLSPMQGRETCAPAKSSNTTTPLFGETEARRASRGSLKVWTTHLYTQAHARITGEATDKRLQRQQAKQASSRPFRYSCICVTWRGWDTRIPPGPSHPICRIGIHWTHFSRFDGGLRPGKTGSPSPKLQLLRQRKTNKVASHWTRQGTTRCKQATASGPAAQCA